MAMKGSQWIAKEPRKGKRTYSVEDFRAWGSQGGRKGGSAGGKKSSAKLTQLQRVERARKAALARHHKQNLVSGPSNLPPVS